MPFLVRQGQGFVLTQMRSLADGIEQLTAELTTVRNAAGRGRDARIACRARQAALEIRKRADQLRSLKSPIAPSCTDRGENTGFDETIDGLVCGKEASADERSGAVHGQNR